MRVDEAKHLAVDLIVRDLNSSPVLITLDTASPDLDVGKFSLHGRVARAIHHFSGWNVKINLDWFAGSYEPPEINRTPFHWYVFAIPRKGPLRRDHYFVCDYLQLRDWVLDFAAPLGNDHRNHDTWRADVRIFTDDPAESTGYFRWGDEPVGWTKSPNRVIQLDNAATLGEVALVPQRVGMFGPGGESAAHRRLKLYVAAHGTEFGMSAAAVSEVEHRFRTGDRVDVMFQNHSPERTVVEIEVAGEDNICIGIKQAVKYRVLAEVDEDYGLASARVGSLVVAYDVNYPKAISLSERYEVPLHTVDRERVLTAAM